MRSKKKAEIMRALYASGCMTYDALRLLEPPCELMQRNVIELSKNGMVDLTGKGREKIITLPTNELEIWNMPEVQKDVPRTYVKRYEELRANIIKYKSDEYRLMRNAKRGELNIAMHVSGIKAYPDERTPIEGGIDFIGSSYYMADEIRKCSGFDVSVEKKNDAVTKINNSRLGGLLVTPDEAFSTYNIGSRLIQWESTGEVRMRTFIENMLAGNNKDVGVGKEVSALFMAWDESVFEKIILNSYRKIDGGKWKWNRLPLVSIDNSYERMYGIPFSRDGLATLKIMKQKNWKETLRYDFLGSEGMDVNPSCNVPCDAIRQDGAYICLFAIPDLVKLKGFLESARYEDNIDEFAIYCFEHQKDMITKLAGDFVRVYSYPITDYLKAKNLG